MEEDILSYLPTVMFRGTSVSMQLGFPIGIPLRGIARNCSRIARNSAELRGNYRVRNCGPCNSCNSVGNPTSNPPTCVSI